jgi:hypothetical protein
METAGTRFSVVSCCRSRAVADVGSNARIPAAPMAPTISAAQHLVELGDDGAHYQIEAGLMRGLSRHGYGILGQSGFFNRVKSVTFEKQKGVFEIVV